MVDSSDEDIPMQNITSPTCSTESHTKFRPSRGFELYAFYNWPLHYKAVEAESLLENLWEQLRAFLFQGRKINRLYTTWAATGREVFSDVTDDTDSFPNCEIWSLDELLSTPPTPLFLACCFGLLSLIQDLESWPTIDWNQKNSEGIGALHLAAEYKHLAVVRMLLKNGADVNAMSDCGTALHFASRRGYNDIVQHLLHCGADLEAKDSRGHNKFVGCCKGGACGDTAAAP